MPPGACSVRLLPSCRLRFAHAQWCQTACGAQACFVHCCADCRAFTESMPHLFDEATLIEKQRAAEAARRTEEAAAREAADAAAAEAAAAEAEADEAGRKVRCVGRLVAESSCRRHGMASVQLRYYCYSSATCEQRATVLLMRKRMPNVVQPFTARASFK